MRSAFFAPGEVRRPINDLIEWRHAIEQAAAHDHSRQRLPLMAERRRQQRSLSDPIHADTGH
jgi:hypothetical protein